MPRAFIVRRRRKGTPFSYRRNCKEDEDERSDSGSDIENLNTNFGSPDSGYSKSPPTGALFRERYEFDTVDGPNVSIPSTPPHPYPPILNTPNFSPLYFSTFDRLRITSPYSVPNNGFLSPSESPNKKRAASDLSDKVKSPKKPKAVRKLQFDEDKSSPVSGTIIKEFGNDEEGQISGDIDPALNFVEVTPEARAELEKIENKIGDYICQLCKERYDDAFQLAQHRCSRIVHVEYRCPECDKVFNCPANLASHRRWHKPRPANTPKKGNMPRSILPQTNIPMPDSLITDPLMSREAYPSDSDSGPVSPPSFPASPHSQLASPCSDDGQFECDTCGKKFRRQAYLRKHQLTHTEEPHLPCHYCGKLFRSESSRSKHAQIHIVGSGNKDYMCGACGMGFGNKHALEKHAKLHSNELFTCKYCSQSFYSSPGLTRHINKCHPSENRQVILLQVPSLTRPC